MPVVLLAIGLKVALMTLDISLLPINTYFSTLVAANVFLLGFLISGVLPDYKEAEKLPAEIAAALGTIIDECRALYGDKKIPEARLCIAHTQKVAQVLIEWFNEETKTRQVMTQLSAYAELFVGLEAHTQANFIVRLKQEVSSIRKMVLRIRNIRQVPFAGPAYAVAELFTTLVIISVLVVDIGDALPSVLITGSITYVLCYMIALINDLDNPFHYNGNPHLSDEIAIEPLGAVLRNIDEALGKEKKQK